MPELTVANLPSYLALGRPLLLLFVGSEEEEEDDDEWARRETQAVLREGPYPRWGLRAADVPGLPAPPPRAGPVPAAQRGALPLPLPRAHSGALRPALAGGHPGRDRTTHRNDG
ncbi:unnamed protein product [Gadus morhua 'NCC']